MGILDAPIPQDTHGSLAVAANPIPRQVINASIAIPNPVTKGQIFPNNFTQQAGLSTIARSPRSRLSIVVSNGSSVIGVRLHVMTSNAIANQTAVHPTHEIFDVPPNQTIGFSSEALSNGFGSLIVQLEALSPGSQSGKAVLVNLFSV